MEEISEDEECRSEREDGFPMIHSRVDENVETFCRYEMSRYKLQSSVLVRKYESRGLSFQLWPAANAVCWYLENEFGEDGMCISSLPSDAENLPDFPADLENVSEENVLNLPGAVVDHIDSERLMFRSHHSCPPGNRRLKVLELGSGTGMVGIVAACLGAHVILTDLPHVIPNLEYNIDLNRAAIQAARGSVESRVLRWGVEEDIKTLGDLASFDLIIASDVVYYDTLFGPLLQTLKWLVEAAEESLNQRFKSDVVVSDPVLRPPLAWSSPGKIDQSHGGVYNGALGAGKVDFSKRKNPPVIYLGHVRRWKKDAHFFKQASKIFDVDVVHRHPPQNNVRVGPIIYRLTVKPNRSSISAVS